MAISAGLRPWEFWEYEYKELYYVIQAHNQAVQRNERLVWESTRALGVLLANASGNLKKPMGAKDWPLPWDAPAKPLYTKEERKRIEELSKILD